MRHVGKLFWFTVHSRRQLQKRGGDVANPKRRRSGLAEMAMALQGLVIILLAVVGARTALAAEPSEAAFFENEIRPILVNHCYACHSAETKPAGELRVDDRKGLLRGGSSGPAVVPGDTQGSVLLQRVRHTDPRRRMPKEGSALTETQISQLAKWIQNGAHWPEEKLSLSPAAPPAMYQQLRAKHWAFQPLRTVPPPSVKDSSWAQNPVDLFLQAKREANGVRTVSPADKRQLLRRLSFDLTGLPPTAKQTANFLASHSPQAYERLVDELLGSKAFAEHWARHWLDVARFGESTGPSRNVPFPHAWRYRQYVIDALTADLPINQFLQEQIAGDLLPAANVEARDRLLTATGFLALGPKDVNQRFRERYVMDNVAEQIDTVTRSTLALTVGCARCHDHKFDPIPTADYYALAGIFTSTEDAAGLRNKMGGAGLDYYDPKMLLTMASYVPRVPEERVAKLRKETEEAKQAWENIRGTAEGLTLMPNGKPKQQPFRLRYEKLQAELLQITDPGSYGFALHGARDAAKPADTAIRLRGEAEKEGVVVPRGFLSAIEVPGARPVNPNQSGRKELAEWITHRQNPLTARVFVNRVWHHLFGRGLVSTVDNFGLTGDRPSHPELLDTLALRFMEQGWSLRKLVKELVLTRSYRLSSEANTLALQIDPENRLLWRHSPRRLQAEEIRDTVLWAAGQLQPAEAEKSPVRQLPMVEIRDNGPESRQVQEHAERSRVRSLYLPLLRGLTPRTLETFDPPAQSLVTGQRETTNVPTQALFLLNSVFIGKQSLALAERLQDLPQGRQRVARAYESILGRPPDEREIVAALRFVDAYQGQYAKEPPISVTLGPAVAAKAVAPKPPLDPDNVDRTEVPPTEETVVPGSPVAAAWMSLVQTLFATAEFRLLR